MEPAATSLEEPVTAEVAAVWWAEKMFGGAVDLSAEIAAVEPVVTAETVESAEGMTVAGVVVESVEEVVEV